MVYSHLRHLQALATVPVRVLVTEPGTGSATGSSTGEKFSSGRVLVVT